MVSIWQAIFGGSNGQDAPTLLLGHSMGGAIAVCAAATKAMPSLAGVVVVDVVEGTALGKMMVSKWFAEDQN